MGRIVVDFDEFVYRARYIHNDKYQYSRESFSGLKFKTDIICEDHGVFQQTASKHVSGQGCRKCFFDSLRTFKKHSDFVKEMDIIHNEKYSYPENLNGPDSISITVKCPNHGLFTQTRANHVSGKGCRKCSDETKKIELSFDEFLKSAEITHNGRYQYNVTDYIDRNTPFPIFCNIHGNFSQSPASHLRGRGCGRCGLTKFSTFEFQKDLDRTFGKKYIVINELRLKSSNRYKIECFRHGILVVIPHRFLETQGCQKCKTYEMRVESVEKWLILKKLSFEKDFIIDNKELKGSFYVKDFNALITIEKIPAEVRHIVDKTDFRLIEITANPYIFLNPLLKEFRENKSKETLPKILKMKCSEGHDWNVHRGSLKRAKCPYCSNRKVLCGFNDIGCINPELVEEWGVTNSKTPHEMVYGSNTSVEWRCKSNHIWMAPVASRYKGSGCRECHLSNRGKLTLRLLKDERPELANEVVQKAILETLTIGSHTKIDWMCSKGHIYNLSPNRRRVGVCSCPYCSNQKVLQGFNDISAVSQKLNDELYDKKDAELAFWSREPIKWRHITEKGVEHIWTSSPSSRCVYKSGCLICLGKQVMKGVNDLATTHPEIVSQWGDNSHSIHEVSKGSTKHTKFICSKGHSYEGRIIDVVLNKSFCEICGKDDSSYRSKGEKELLAFIKEEFPKLSIEENIRSFRKQGVSEIDILIEKKIAIDFNGDFWHQEGVYKPIGFHVKKSNALLKLGFKEITVWENQWVNDRSKCENTIKEIVSSFLEVY